jgi:quercetin dioxygenase-like cupin family protein
MPQTAVHHAKDDRFEIGLRPYFAYRDLGVDKATGGAFGAHVIRAVPGTHATGQWHTHALGFQFVYVLNGWVEFEYEDIGFVRLEKGSTAYQPPMVRHREVRHSDDVELLEIVMPGEFPTTVVDGPRSEAQPAESEAQPAE